MNYSTTQQHLSPESRNPTPPNPGQCAIYRHPLERLYGHNPELLGQQIRHVVLHEVAHHFGISDQRLIEISRY